MSELEVKTFLKVTDWHNWLEKNHGTSSGVFVQFFKKNSPTQGISYDEALDEALCYGWIDSQVKRFDEISYLQKFSPRKNKSIWSKINTQRIERLIKERRMKPAGMEQVAKAKEDGRWESAYHPPSSMHVPNDFLSELSQNKKAHAFFQTLNKTNTYAILWRIETAKKPETRKQRIQKIISMLSKKETFH